MDERALLALHARLGPGQLERFAAFAAHHGPLLLDSPQARASGTAFTLAIATALRCTRQPGEAEPDSERPT